MMQKAVIDGSVIFGSVFLVFEYVEHDMGRLLDSMKAPFRESEVKCLLLQVSFSPPPPPPPHHHPFTALLSPFSLTPLSVFSPCSAKRHQPPTR